MQRGTHEQARFAVRYEATAPVSSTKPVNMAPILAETPPA